MNSDFGPPQVIDPKLLDAYRKTVFIVDAPAGEITLRAGAYCYAIDALLKRYGTRECGFITAWNPGSVRLDSRENARRQADLIRAVEALGHPTLPGRGLGEDLNWKPEESILIIGISRADAVKLGAAFGQLAILFKQVSNPCELVLCGN